MYNIFGIIEEKLNSKKERLVEILKSNEPVVPSHVLIEAHERRVNNAKEYLGELEELEMAMFPHDMSVLLASSEREFQKGIQNAAESEVCFAGKWCKMAYISEELGEMKVLMFAKAVNAI